ELVSSSTGVTVQAASEIVPVWPSAVAEADENVTVPNFVSGSGLHLPKPSQPDGASAIHSAEETSGADAVSILVNVVLRVRFAIRSVTTCPATATLAL